MGGSHSKEALVERERFQIELTTHALYLRAEFKQFLYRRVSRAGACCCAMLRPSPFVVGKKTPFTVRAATQGRQK